MQQVSFISKSTTSLVNKRPATNKQSGRSTQMVAKQATVGS